MALLKDSPTRKGAIRSTRPEQIRTRIRRGTQDVKSAIPMLGMPDIETWSFAELCAGKPKGYSKQAPPPWITPAVEEELVRRVRIGAYAELRKIMPTALKALARIAADDDNSHQFQAIKLILEYVIGTPERRVAVREATVGEKLLADLIVFDDGDEMYTGRMIEGSVVEEDDDDLPD